jgi:hypothetical protein
MEQSEIIRRNKLITISQIIQAMFYNDQNIEVYSYFLIASKTDDNIIGIQLECKHGDQIVIIKYLTEDNVLKCFVNEKFMFKQDFIITSDEWRHVFSFVEIFRKG